MACTMLPRVWGASSWCLVSKWVRSCDFTTPYLWLLHIAMQRVGKYTKIED
jgi:hypothetical protein